MNRKKVSPLIFIPIVFGLYFRCDREKKLPGEGFAPEKRKNIAFEEWFGEGAMRIDLMHTAESNNEWVGIEKITLEPVWTGTRKFMIDPFNYGVYRFKVFDSKSGILIFSRGFSTLLSEWRTTPEAKLYPASMGESLRFPLPKKKVRIELESRNKKGEFKKILSFEVDPGWTAVNRDSIHSGFETIPIFGNGKSYERKVDIAILPEGYERRHEIKMVKDANRFAFALLNEEPFSRHREKFNLTMLKAFSRESGADEPRKKIFKDTLFGLSFNTFGAERYLTTPDNSSIRKLASAIPYDIVVIMVNTARYGGGGIYNFWSIFPSDNEFSEYIALHEFGHAFAGLGDEYYQPGGGYDEDEFYPPGVEPWEPNLTAFIDGKIENIKWKDMMGKDVPVPTPPEERWKNRVGLFEGAGYKSKGLFRGYLDCKMFHKGAIPFCPVCKRAIEAMIRYYTD